MLGCPKCEFATAEMAQARVMAQAERADDHPILLASFARCFSQVNFGRDYCAWLSLRGLEAKTGTCNMGHTD